LILLMFLRGKQIVRFLVWFLNTVRTLEGRLHRDEVHCIIRALGEFYRGDRLRKGYMKRFR
jgi:hypothetical protein